MMEILYRWADVKLDSLQVLDATPRTCSQRTGHPVLG